MPRDRFLSADEIDRFLSADEIKRLAEVLADHRNRRCANIIRLLLLTGARRGEVLRPKLSLVPDAESDAA